MTRRKDVLQEKFYTAREAIVFLRISRATFWRWANKNPALVPVYPMPGRPRWPESALRKVMQGGKAAT
jgi:predicted DNA-binding transcriptional regulator AlpA